MNEFMGCPEDMYRFFWEIFFRNDKAFFEENRERYNRSVKQPMYALAEKILPAAREMDPQFDTRIPVLVSRIRRDTRFSKDKTLYRDHVWIGFKYPERHMSECFSVYCAFERECYSYGMGMYAPEPAMMKEIRERIMARPQLFLSLVNAPAFKNRFTISGETYKKPKFTEVEPELLRWLNFRSIGFHYSCPDIERTSKPEIADEIIEAFHIMKPVYRFLKGLD